MLTSYHQGNCHFSLNRENVVKVKVKKAPVVEELQEKPKKKRRKKS